MPSSGVYKFKKKNIKCLTLYLKKNMIKIILFDLLDPTIFSLIVGS
jgi:hypothetical protein